MRVYRGTRDISPLELDHQRLSHGVYGLACYYALNYSDAKMYSGGGYGDCAIVASYEIAPKNCLEIEEHQWQIKNVADAKISKPIDSRLQDKLDYQNQTLAPVSLSKIATQSGFDAIWLKGMVEGGEQIITPEGVSLELFQLDLFLSRSMLGESKDGKHLDEFLNILEDHGIVVIQNNYQLEFSLTPTKLSQLQDLFNFIFNVIKKRSFYKIDFKALSADPYDE